MVPAAWMNVLAASDEDACVAHTSTYHSAKEEGALRHVVPRWDGWLLWLVCGSPGLLRCALSLHGVWKKRRALRLDADCFEI